MPPEVTGLRRTAAEMYRLQFLPWPLDGANYPSQRYCRIWTLMWTLLWVDCSTSILLSHFSSCQCFILLILLSFHIMFAGRALLHFSDVLQKSLIYRCSSVADEYMDLRIRADNEFDILFIWFKSDRSLRIWKPRFSLQGGQWWVWDLGWALCHHLKSATVFARQQKKIKTQMLRISPPLS